MICNIKASIKKIYIAQKAHFYAIHTNFTSFSLTLDASMHNIHYTKIYVHIIWYLIWYRCMLVSALKIVQTPIKFSVFNSNKQKRQEALSCFNYHRFHADF